MDSSVCQWQWGFLLLLLQCFSLMMVAYPTLQTTPPDEEFCRAIPKVELHAHLHGSIRESTLLDLAQAQGLETPTLITESDERTLDECFKIFNTIHKIVTSKEIIQRITREVLEDFAIDGVKYVELRTTPRSLPDGTTPKEYVLAVLQVLEEYIDEHGGEASILEAMQVPVPRLLLSVDRGGTAAAALATARLAAELAAQSRLVVGIDFSGNPFKGTFKEFRPAFELARANNLSITMHCAEIDNTEDSKAILDFRRIDDEDQQPASAGGMPETTLSSSDLVIVLRPLTYYRLFGSVELYSLVMEAAFLLNPTPRLGIRPDRIGHMVAMSSEVELALLSIEPPIPIEICPSSNYKTLDLNSHRDHPTVKKWLMLGYPFSVNTDDTGVFGTSLSKELCIIAEAFHLDSEAVKQISLATVQHIFDRKLVPVLQDRFESVMERLMVFPGAASTMGGVVLDHREQESSVKSVGGSSRSIPEMQSVEL